MSTVRHERLWRDQFDWVYREYDWAVFPLTIHPDVSGRPQVLLMLERLIEYIRGIRAYAGARWKGWQKSSGAVIRSRADLNRLAQNAIGGCDEFRKIPGRILQGHGGG